jgi:hypothetical protein
VEALARQIRLTGRAYPVFDIGHLILNKPDRYQVTFSALKKPDGQVAQELCLCSIDDTLWLGQEEAISHVLRKHFGLFYQAEKSPTAPPKGTYTFVAQCGLSGTILGPPNYHDYQTKLRKLHASRFARMPFEAYKARVRIVRDEATVKQWIEEQSWKTEYNCLNVPEPLKLSSREAADKHFREVHAANLIRQTDSWTATGAAAQQLPCAPLRRLLRRAWDEQQRFPLKLVTVLSQQFAGHGLHFFKVNKTVTHVSVARPHYLDSDATPVSEGVRRIIEFVRANEGCTRRKLMDALAPAPPVPRPVPPADPAGSAATTAPPAPPSAEPTPEQTAVVADVHWLIHEGHIIEFANGRIESAKRPKPKPAKPETAQETPASAISTDPGQPATEAAHPAANPLSPTSTEAPSLAEPVGSLPPPQSSDLTDSAATSDVAAFGQPPSVEEPEAPQRPLSSDDSSTTPA